MTKYPLIILLAAIFSIAAFAQPLQLSTEFTPLPIDPQLRYGKLANGLTYYIRQNSEPRDRADFYIAQRVGSMQEEENQRGLAHFLEHLAFNGTKHFPGKSMLNYLESIGAKFGANVNAYTSFDETVYNLSDIPTTRNGIIDSCLLVLHDWACAISLNEPEIEAERPVIIEEWRTRNTGQMRIYESLIPQLYPDSRYANRMPIGDTAIIANFPPQQLRDYYHKWYRPDLQGIIIVGDFDPDLMESKVKHLFGSIEPHKNPAERIYFPVQDNTDPIVAIAVDKELPNASVTVYYKHNVIPEEMRNTVTAAMMSYIYSVSSSMLNSRLDEIVQKPNPPFIAARADDGRFFISATKDAFTIRAICAESNSEVALQRIMEEVQRFKQHGFTASEYERARAQFLSGYENAFNERNRHTNSAYVQEYVDHFLNGGFIPGIEIEYQLYKKLAPEIPVEQVNQVMQNYIGDKNMAISMQFPEKNGFTTPTNNEILSIYDIVKDIDLEPYEDVVLNQPLISELPHGKKIVRTVEEPRFGATVWTLENGATVVIKQTDFKEDEIMMKAVSLGGNSLVADINAPEIKTFNEIISLGGLANFSAIDLQKLLAGKRAGASLELNTYSEAVNASCSPKDLETMMQLIYLNFTAPRKDIDAFRSYTARLKDYLQNNEMNPMTIFGDSLTSSLFPNNIRAKRLKSEDVDRIVYESVLRIQHDRFKYASDFTFIFVGNIDKEKLKPLVEQYIGALKGSNASKNSNARRGFLAKLLPPAKDPGESETYRDLKMYPRSGIFENRFRREMQTPKVTVAAIYSAKIKYSLENAITMSMLKNLLDIVYTEKIREEQGGTYGVSVSGTITPSPPKDLCMLQIAFDTNKEQSEQLLKKAHEILKDMSINEPDQESFAKAKEYMLKQHAQNLRTNGYWLSALNTYYLWDADMAAGYEETLQSITPSKVAFLIQQILTQRNLTEVIMEP